MERWFMSDPNASIFETFETQAEALEAASEAIEEYNNDGWDGDAVEQITVGHITHEVRIVDKRPDPSGEFDYLCGYKMVPVGETEQPVPPEVLP